MEFVGLLLIVAFVAYFAMRLGRNQQNLERQQASELESQLAGVKRVAEEDVTTFGEELQRLDADVAGRPLDDATREDYTRALDSYEHAKESLTAVQRTEEIRFVTEILEEGRYQIACVKARVAGEPLPAKRPPCFFDPAHGPSSGNVDWAPPGGSVRSVPACLADAERVLAGAEPHLRTVAVGAQRVPYWQAGGEYAPYAQGYYSNWRGSTLIRDIAIGSLIFHGIGALPHVAAGLGHGLEEVGESLGDGLEGLGEGIGDLLGGLFD
ncbi:MAG: hypothetical protein IPL36_00240 [Nigerium sp.]|nr:hypothetical protein [Nigerium sp.]